MASIVLPVTTRGVSIGRVLQRAFDTARHNPAVSIAVAFLFGAFPGLVVELLLSGIDRSALVLTIAGYPLPGAFALLFLEWFASFVFGVLVQGAMIAPVLAEDRGERAIFGAALRSLFRTFPSLIGLGLLTGLAAESGLTIFVVPGILVYLLWSVAPSAAAVEGDGTFMALGRSQELTQGARWKIFGLFLLLEAINVVVSFGAMFLAAQLFSVSIQHQASAGYLMTIGLMGTLINLTWGTVQCSLYVELVRWKEGDSVESLEQVFA